jgi:hypothetical protein
MTSSETAQIRRKQSVFEVEPGGRPDLPIAAEQPLALERR